ncbi:MAG TPA: hypothetical protein VF540_12085 [Segetibacter sp.]|jgi:hypothetical protein
MKGISNMKFFYCVILLICLMFQNVICHSQTAKHLSLMTSKNEQSKLELSGEIKKLGVCSSGKIIRLNINLNYKNIGSNNIILYKNVDIIYEYIVSKNPVKNNSGKYEIKVTPTITGSALFEGNDIFPHEQFVLLKPGESYEISSNPVYFSLKDGKKERLKAGEYFLQVTVPTFPFSREISSDLPSKWAKYGFLWTGNIISNPISFLINTNDHLSTIDCNSYN